MVAIQCESKTLFQEMRLTLNQKDVTIISYASELEETPVKEILSEDKFETGKAVMLSLVNTGKHCTESNEQDTSHPIRNDATCYESRHIRPIYDEEQWLRYHLSILKRKDSSFVAEKTEYSEATNGFKDFQLMNNNSEFNRTTSNELSSYKAGSKIHKLLTRVLRIILVILPEHPSDTYVLTMKMEILLEPASNKLLSPNLRAGIPCQGDFLIYLISRIHKDGDGDASFQLESNSLPHAHAQTTKTFYKHQDSRIMKAQELKTKTSAQTLIYKIFLQRYQVYQGRLLASFQDDAKYEHVGQDTRSQGGKDDQDKQGKDLKISDIKTKSKDNDKGSRSKITKHEGTSLQRIQRPRPQDLNDKSNLIDLMKECHNELTSGEIVSLKILSRTMEVRSLY
ncbi:hypothetical protein Tco_0291555 [Tanacetum coccineum]